MEPAPIEDLSYEQAVTELEEVVAALESNQHTLEESITLFERGQALAAHCTTLLEKAELKVQQLQQGELSPFATEA